MIRIKTPHTLGVVLRETRTAQRIPAAELAAMANTTPVTLRRLEQGTPTAAITTLFMLLDELGLELHVSLPPDVPAINIPDEQTPPRRTRVRP